MLKAMKSNEDAFSVRKWQGFDSGMTLLMLWCHVNVSILSFIYLFTYLMEEIIK